MGNIINERIIMKISTKFLHARRKPFFKRHLKIKIYKVTYICTHCLGHPYPVTGPAKVL